MVQNNHIDDLVNHPGLTQDDIALLRERSETLASETKELYSVNNDMVESYLIVSYLDERYGIPLTVVSEAIALSNVVALPGAPPHVVGLTRLRGQILALVNLHVYWRQRITGHSDCDRAVIVTINELSFGLVCYRVEGLRKLPDSVVEPTPADLPSLTKNTIQGIADRNILLLDPEKLIAAPGFTLK